MTFHDESDHGDRAACRVEESIECLHSDAGFPRPGTSWDEFSSITLRLPTFLDTQNSLTFLAQQVLVTLLVFPKYNTDM